MRPIHWIIIGKVTVVACIAAMVNCLINDHSILHGLLFAGLVGLNLYNIELWSSVNE